MWSYILISVLGLVIGAIVSYMIMKNDVPKGYIAGTTYELLERKFNENDKELKQKREDVIGLNNQLTELKGTEKHLNDKIADFNKEVTQRDQIVKDQFKNLAAEIFKEKGKDFVGKNEELLNTLLKPLQKDITDFKTTIENTQKDSIRDITSLKTSLQHMQETSAQLSKGTIELTNALNADVKIQGGWGEDRLNLILQMEGLQKHIDYSRETVIRDEEDKLKRPDFIIKLPQNRCIIVDSKVTLTSYTDYVNAVTPEEKKNHLKRMVDSIKKHIELLSSKEYQNLPGMITLDFVVMFVPIEAALTYAIYHSPEIYKLASDKRVVILTPTTLIPIAKVIKQLWDNENRISNIENIFKKVGSLYDKFKGFTDDMMAIERNLKFTQDAYNNAMNKLTESVRHGDTVIGRFQELTTMGVKVKNQIDSKIVQAIEMKEDAMEIKSLSENQSDTIEDAQIITEENKIEDNIKDEEQSEPL